MKRFNIQYNVGKVKYLVNYHNGCTFHEDGSDFFDIATPKNKKDLSAFIEKIISYGYIETK